MPTMSASYQRDRRAKIAQGKADGFLLPFQKRFVASLTRKEGAPEIGILSTPRAQGKSWLCGQLIGRSLTPGDVLHENAVENVLVASSRSQAAITLEFARQACADVPGIRWANDGAIHVETRARIKIISSDARRSLGLGAHARWLFCDEPSAWSPQAGRRLIDSMRTALGKRKCQIVLCGTVAPSPTQGPGSWWPELVKAGSGAGVHLELLQADEKKWRDWDECLRVNPAHLVNPFLEKTLRREFEDALKAERSAIPFRQYRLNLPGGESTGEQPVLTPEELSRVYSRQVPERSGQPVVGCDLGGGRSWSACAAVWPNGRVEVWCLAAGDVTLEEAARLDQLPEDAYTSLAQSGGLVVDSDRTVPSPENLLARIWAWNPQCVVADGYRATELRTAIAGRCPLVERGRGNSDTASNVQAMRSALLDGLAGVTASSRALLAFGFEQSAMTIGADGVTRVVKTRGKRSREDAVAALLLASGHSARRPAPVQLRGAVIDRQGRVVTWL